MWETTIKTEPPYHFDGVLDRLSIDPLNVVDVQEKMVKVPLYIEDNPTVVTVKSIGTKEEPAFWLQGEDIACKEKVIQRVSHIFQWDVPLKEIHTHFLHTNLRDIFVAHEGTPLILDFDPYSCLMKCIIHQQLNMAFAHTLTERFVKTFGFEKDGVWFYPRAEKVAELSYDDLRALQFSTRKAEYVIDTSRLIAEGKVSLEELENKSDEEVIKQLVKNRGIGPWTAQNFLLFGLGRPNLFPKADIGIQNAIKKHFQLEQKPTFEQMDEISKEWAPYLSYASLYLWRSIEKRKMEMSS
jgi:DNA-3-methyladenine glycosylase II